jgi:hypothetical protein
VPRASCFLVFAGLLFTSSCLGIADQFSLLVGSVRASDGRPIQGARVRFLKPHASIEPYFSDATGCFAVTLSYSPREREVLLEIEKPGYKTWQYPQKPGRFEVADAVLTRIDEVASSQADIRKFVREDNDRYPCTAGVIR